MILSNREIQKALDEKRLVITPEPIPRNRDVGVKYCPYDTHSVDLRLYHEISVPEPGPFVFDLTEEGNLARLMSQVTRKHTLSKQQPYHLKPNEFILARTVEVVELPVPAKLAARIEGKSSRARCGLLVHFTAPTVHPGWKGPLTLEMINLSPVTFVLKPEMPIAQLIIEQVIGDIAENPSQYQNQTTPEGLRKP
jgi:dCTP deaminase